MEGTEWEGNCKNAMNPKQRRYVLGGGGGFMFFFFFSCGLEDVARVKEAVTL